MNNQKYILWLPSWYPDKLSPFNGDFIQRHARAASLHYPVTVIFFSQHGEKMKMQSEVVESCDGNLKEVIVYVPFSPLGFQPLDRIRYNFAFYWYAKRFLNRYFRQHGLPSLIHVHIPVKSGNLARWITKRFRIPYIVSEHASTYLKEAPDYFFHRHWLYRSQVRQIFTEAKSVINVSRAVGEILQQLFAIKRLEIIHNVVDTDYFQYVPNAVETFTYIHVSSLHEQKNITGILHAFRRLSEINSDWRLKIVGPYKKEHQELIESENLRYFIELAGELPYTEVARQMQQAHVLVLFSRHENFPCVVVEALCCGLPVVSSDVAGIKEAINTSNGILVPPEDGDALLAALLKIREQYDAYNRASIASDAKNTYSYPVIARQFAELYKRTNVG